MRSTVTARLRSDRGATLIEYVLTLSLLTVVALPQISIVGNNSAQIFNRSALAMSSAPDNDVTRFGNGDSTDGTGTHGTGAPKGGDTSDPNGNDSGRGPTGGVGSGQSSNPGNSNSQSDGDSGQGGGQNVGGTRNGPRR